MIFSNVFAWSGVFLLSALAVLAADNDLEARDGVRTFTTTGVVTTSDPGTGSGDPIVPTTTPKTPGMKDTTTSDWINTRDTSLPISSSKTRSSPDTGITTTTRGDTGQPSSILPTGRPTEPTPTPPAPSSNTTASRNETLTTRPTSDGERPTESPTSSPTTTDGSGSASSYGQACGLAFLVVAGTFVFLGL